MRTLFFFFLSGFVIIGCQKKGCIDRLARNYDSSAKREAACYYDGKLTLWVDNESAAKHQSKMLNWYLDNELVLTDSTLQGTVVPLCEDPKGRLFVRDLGTNTSGTVSCRVVQRDQNLTIADTVVNLFGGYCVTQQIILK